MKNFFSNFNLYKPFVIQEEYKKGTVTHLLPNSFKGETFEYYCERENAFKTFEIELSDAVEHYYDNDFSSEMFIDNNLDYTFQCFGRCRSCKIFKVEFLLRVFTDNPIPKRLISGPPPAPNANTSHLPKKEYDKAKLQVEKVGCSPKIKITPNKEIEKFFDRETNNWYYKGLNSIAQNFGIGAFAYFRRIIEKELIGIIEDIKSLPAAHSEEIEILLEKHKKNPSISSIYDNIFPHLPNSLKILGDNPIKLLYNQTSEGLHSLTDKKCLEKSENILRLLEFTIQKINEERSDIKDLREAIKSLK